MAEIVATTSLPVNRLKATDCNAAARAKILYSQGQCLVNDLFYYKAYKAIHIGQIRRL